MRTYLRSALVHDQALASLGVVPAGVVSGDADSNYERPLINLQWGETTPGIGPVNRRVLVVWAHDVPGSYVRLDLVVSRIIALFLGLRGGQTQTGWLNQIEWLTTSGDLRNDDRKTILRTCTFQVVGSGLG